MSSSLLPEDQGVSPEAELAAAVAEQLGVAPELVPLAEDAAQPFGMSWQFDFELGQFIRAGGSPARTSGFGALEQWCLMAIHSARFAHPAVFTDDFGLEHPDYPLGEFVEGEILADYSRRLVEALLVHDRISSVENVKLDWDPSTGILTIESLDVVTDEGDSLTLQGLPIDTGGMR